MTTAEILTLIVSIIALGSAIIFSILQQRHNNNAVWPHIDFMINQSDGLIFVKIKNAGTGPLIVKKMTVTIDGVEKNSVISCFKFGGYDRMEQVKKYYELDGGRLVEGKVLSPDTIFPLFYIKLRNDIEIEKNDEYYRLLAELLYILRKIHIKIEYMNIYKKGFDVKRDFSEVFGQRHEEFLSKEQPDVKCNDFKD